MSVRLLSMLAVTAIAAGSLAGGAQAAPGQNGNLSNPDPAAEANVVAIDYAGTQPVPAPAVSGAPHGWADLHTAKRRPWPA